MKKTILEILKKVGVYDQARNLVQSDNELVRLFDEDFFGLIEQVSKKGLFEDESKRPSK